MTFCFTKALALKCINCESVKDPKCTEAKGLQGEVMMREIAHFWFQNIFSRILGLSRAD